LSGNFTFAAAVGHHLGHQRRIVGGDVVADELGHVGEAHDPPVELHPLVHLPEFHVADDVVDGLEVALGLQTGGDGRPAVDDRVAGDEAGQERSVVVGPVDQRVDGVAVGADGCDPYGAVLVGEVVRFRGGHRAGGERVRVRPVDVRDREGDVGDAVAVLGDMVGA
jgi:hypothetical protein